jgi:RNase P/RNase MRP subunit p30
MQFSILGWKGGWESIIGMHNNTTRAKMINTSNIEQAKKLIRKSIKKPIIVKAQNDDFNRKILEYGKFDILLFPESGKRRIPLKQSDSGLNHVLAKIATNNNIRIGIDIQEIESLSKVEKAKCLSRIKQNIAICKRAKTKLSIFNSKDKKDSFHFILSLGASTSQAKEATKTF